DLDLKGEVTQLLAYNYHFLGQSDKSLEYSDEWRKAEKKKTQEAIDAKNYELVLAFNDRVVAESKRVEAENDKLTAEQKQQLYLILFLFATILGLLAAFYAYRQKGRRKRAEKEKQQKIESILKENEIKTIRARLNGIDEERARISEDLHDGIGIMLTGTQLHFEALGERLDNMEASNKEQFDAAFKLLTQTQQQTRRVIHDMANQTLLNYGLIAQVNELLSMLKKASDVNINFSTQGIPDPNQWSSAFEMKIYKVIQELINNALKNANADNLDIQIQQIENELSLSVKDDGEGFDVNESYEGMGMRTVENRVKDLGGVLSINSVKGKGTNILIKNIHLN
ncbi:MAG: sensor histidine kinase, partial [Bacteroidota bacterium]